MVERSLIAIAMDRVWSAMAPKKSTKSKTGYKGVRLRESGQYAAELRYEREFFWKSDLESKKTESWSWSFSVP